MLVEDITIADIPLRHTQMADATTTTTMKNTTSAGEFLGLPPRTTQALFDKRLGEC